MERMWLGSRILDSSRPLGIRVGMVGVGKRSQRTFTTTKHETQTQPQQTNASVGAHGHPYQPLPQSAQWQLGAATIRRPSAPHLHHLVPAGRAGGCCGCLRGVVPHAPPREATWLRRTAPACFAAPAIRGVKMNLAHPGTTHLLPTAICINITSTSSTYNSLGLFIKIDPPAPAFPSQAQTTGPNPSEPCPQQQWEPPPLQSHHPASCPLHPAPEKSIFPCSSC